ncbi:MAG TPA: ABC transporter ATP-binding protein [Planctomycetota bacterium]|nr:ABC transporter ATP-binding protein [Planctomycetota bacterium]
MDEFDVTLRGVTRTFGGRRAVDDVTLDIRRGEFFSLLGPSGCGKTTLMRIIAGFESADSGSVTLAGVDMAGVPPHRRDVNMVFQSYALFPHLSVAGNIAFGLRIAKADDIGGRIARALAKVNLSGYEPRSITTLSGGEQQRVALARAIVTGPRVLLLDEPLSALDLKLRKGLQAELRRLQRELAMTFIFVTHDQEEALAMSDRIAVMNQGRVEQVGTPEDIYEQPSTRFTAEFVGAGNFFEGSGDGRTFRTRDGLSFQAAASGEAIILVRPEKMKIAAGAGLACRVEEVLYQGASRSIILRAGERRLLVEDANDGASARVRVGETTAVSWRPEDVLVLPR